MAYAIGVAHPVGLFVQTFGTGTVPDAQIQEAITGYSTCVRPRSWQNWTSCGRFSRRLLRTDTSDEAAGRNSRGKAPTGRTHSPQPCRVRSPGRGREKADGSHSSEPSRSCSHR